MKFKQTPEYQSLVQLVGDRSTRNSVDRLLFSPEYRPILETIERLTQTGERETPAKAGQLVPEYTHGLGYQLGETLLFLTTLVADISQTENFTNIRQEQLTEGLQRLHDKLENILSFMTEHYDTIRQNTQGEDIITVTNMGELLSELITQQDFILKLKTKISALDLSQTAQQKPYSAAGARNFWTQQDQQAHSAAHSPATDTSKTVNVVTGNGSR